jgi:hypothetical protein
MVGQGGGEAQGVADPKKPVFCFFKNYLADIKRSPWLEENR